MVFIVFPRHIYTAIDCDSLCCMMDYLNDEHSSLFEDGQNMKTDRVTFYNDRWFSHPTELNLLVLAMFVLLERPNSL